MNIVIVTGNLTKDLTTRKASNGNTIANGTIAVSRDFKNNEGNYETDFINFSCFGVTADFLAKYTHKGDRVELVGSWNTRRYTDKDNVEHKVDEIAVSKANKVPTMKAEDDEAKPKKQPKTPQEIYQEQQNKFLDSLEENERKELDLVSDDLPF